MPAELVVPAGADQVQHDATEAKFSKLVLHISLTFITHFVVLTPFGRTRANNRNESQVPWQKAFPDIQR